MHHRTRNKPILALSVIVLLSLFLAACATAPVAPPAQQAEAAPTEAVVTEAPTEEATTTPAEEAADPRRKRPLPRPKKPRRRRQHLPQKARCPHSKAAPGR